MKRCLGIPPEKKVYEKHTKKVIAVMAVTFFYLLALRTPWAELRAEEEFVKRGAK